jgi:hypothetical protein
MGAISLVTCALIGGAKGSQFETIALLGLSCGARSEKWSRTHTSPPRTITMECPRSQDCWNLPGKHDQPGFFAVVARPDRYSGAASSTRRVPRS